MIGRGVLNARVNNAAKNFFCQPATSGNEFILAIDLSKSSDTEYIQDFSTHHPIRISHDD